MAQVAELQPGGHGDFRETESHPRPITYIIVFVVLLVLTGLEVAVAMEPLRSMLPQVPILLLLALVKGAVIVLFYMHLKQDSRIFSAFFVAGLLLAVTLILTLMGIFYNHYRLPFDQVAYRKTIMGGEATTGSAAQTGAGATTQAPTTPGK